MLNLPFPEDAVALTVNECAEFLRLSPKTIRRRIEDGELPAIKLERSWRIARSDLKTYLQERGDSALANVL